MTATQPLDATVNEILFEALDGGPYDLEKIRGEIQPETKFNSLGIDSLDHTTFLLRVEDHFKVSFRQAEYSTLTSPAAVAQAIEQKLNHAPAAGDHNEEEIWDTPS
jgi:acyl carrier protein